MPIVLTDNGYVLLADVPNAGSTTTDANARSGNPNHDTRSGKFGSGGPPIDRKPEAQRGNADPIEFKRMLDAARDAARLFDLPNEEDIKEFLAGRARNPEQVDIPAFLKLVEEQVMDDLVDLLSQQFRKGSSTGEGLRKVKVSAPKGYLRKTLNSLQPEQAKELSERLIARGADKERVATFFREKGFDEITFADEFDIEPVKEVTLSESLKEAFAEMPPPNVTVTLETPRPVRQRIVERDDRGMAKVIVPEYADAD